MQCKKCHTAIPWIRRHKLSSKRRRFEANKILSGWLSLRVIERIVTWHWDNHLSRCHPWWQRERVIVVERPGHLTFNHWRQLISRGSFIEFVSLDIIRLYNSVSICAASYPRKLGYSKRCNFHTKSLQILIIISTQCNAFPAMGFDTAVF